jgi:hypothetical protein
MRLYHGVHQFVAADDGVCRANVDAQCATYAPVSGDQASVWLSQGTLSRFEEEHGTAITLFALSNL